jgi:hypothetical protein
MAIVHVNGTSVAGRSEYVGAFARNGVSLVLLPEPNNEFDPYAVQVLLVDPSGEAHPVGYLPAQMARRYEFPAFGIDATIDHVRYYNDEPVGFNARFDLATTSKRQITAAA